MTPDPDDQGSPSQWQSAYDRLLDEIRFGTLLPGARLRETELAALISF